MKNNNALIYIFIIATFYSVSTRAQTTDYFADDGWVKPFDVTYPHPNSHYHNGVTYIAYMGASGNGNDPSVASYNHTTGEWKGPVRIGSNPLPNDDYHGKPSIVVDDQGYIHVTFGGHGGTIGLAGSNQYGGYSDGELKHLRSNLPEDIGTGTSDWTRQNPAPGGGSTGDISVYATYPQFIKVSNGDIYFFCRHGNHHSDWTYQKSTDDGVTWGGEVPILAHTWTETWYAWFTVNGDSINCVYNYHPGGSGNDRQDIYYMYLDTSTDTWYNVEGSDLSSKIPMNLKQSKKKTKVKNTNPDNYEVSSIVCRSDTSGIPHIAFQYYNDQAYHMMWDGSDWTSYVNLTTTSATEESKFDIMPISSTDVKVLVRREDASGTKLAWWSMDPTSSYRNEDEVIMVEDTSSYRPAAIPEFYHDDAKVMFFEKTGNDRVKIFMHGDSGLLTRGSGSGSRIASTGEKLSGSSNSIAVLAVDKQLRVYPNPANHRVIVDLGSESLQSVQIFTTNGQLMLSQTEINDSQVEINIQGLKSGYYVMRIHGLSTTDVRTLIKN
ncbi:MAG: BNR-4 repeat-containing protein [Bacteroidota bacterium]